jgi:hypothetical protein
MDYRQFEEQLLETILLLVGLSIFNTGLYAIAPTVDLGEWLIPFTTNSYWIGNLIFGIIIYRLTKQNRKVTVSIAILSIMLPVFGGLMYLLTLTANGTNK